LAFFDFIESGVSMFGKKSKFQKILKKSGIPASQVLSVGDEVRDLRSAHAAKIPFGAVTWGYTDQRTLQAHAPDVLFSHPDQILEAFNISAA
jgi:phosphoglycolate phosphatase